MASCGLVAVGERFTLERVTVPRGGQVASFATLSPPLLLPGGTAASGPLSHAGGPKKSPAPTGPSAPPIGSHFDDELLCGRDAKKCAGRRPRQRIAKSTGLAKKERKKEDETLGETDLERANVTITISHKQGLNTGFHCA